MIAPEGFLEEATSENVMVGTAMGRRSGYQFGKDLERSAKGMVDTGLGKATAYGSFGILQPTLLISQPTQAVVLDGVAFLFHNVPGAEAPAELTFSIPDKKAYCGAEILAQTMHNLLPVRGAKVRNSLRWSEYLDQALRTERRRRRLLRAAQLADLGTGAHRGIHHGCIAMSTSTRTTRPSG